jgi:hypothetical protein
MEYQKLILKLLQDCAVCYPATDKWNDSNKAGWTAKEDVEYVQLQLLFTVFVNPSSSTGKETKRLDLAFVKYFDRFAECRDNGCSIQPGPPKRVNNMIVSVLINTDQKWSVAFFLIISDHIVFMIISDTF